MNRTDALYYYKGVSYSHSLYEQERPVRLDYQGKRYHGYLLNHEPPYRVRLVERIQDGVFYPMPVQEVELDSLEGVEPFAQH